MQPLFTVIASLLFRLKLHTGHELFRKIACRPRESGDPFGVELWFPAFAGKTVIFSLPHSVFRVLVFSMT
jgi:hypothetical protein